MAKKNKGNKDNSSKRFQPHFRKFHDKKTTAHPQYIYGEEGRNYKVIGITSSAYTNGSKNISLERNPDPTRNDKAYVRSSPDKVNKGVRNEKLKGWSFTANDKKKVRTIIDEDKKKK